MAEEIILKVILTIVGFITTGVLGYLSGKIKNYKAIEEKRKEEHEMFKKTLNCLLRSNITSKYYVYSELGEIPYYEKENIDMMYEEYKANDGNSYVETIVKEINNLPIKK